MTLREWIDMDIERKNNFVLDFPEIDISMNRGVLLPTTALDDGAPCADIEHAKFAFEAPLLRMGACTLKIAGKGAYTRPRIDSAGTSICVKGVKGVQIWAIALDAHSPSDGGWADLETKTGWQCVVIREEDTLYARPFSLSCSL